MKKCSKTLGLSCDLGTLLKGNREIIHSGITFRCTGPRGFCRCIITNRPEKHCAVVTPISSVENERASVRALVLN